MEKVTKIGFLLALFALASTAPVEGPEKRDKYEQTMKELRELINNVWKDSLVIENEYREQNKIDVPVNTRISIAQSIDKCKDEFSKGVNDDNFICAMKMMQNVVRVTQDLQMSESGIHHGDETQFVTSFRQLEYNMRNLVEDTMRKEAFAIVHERKQSEIPPYSVGGYVSGTTTDRKNTVLRNMMNIVKIQTSLHLVKKMGKST